MNLYRIELFYDNFLKILLMHIHFIGIGGIGISGLAQYCLQTGNTISGSDISTSDLIDQLKKINIKINIPHDSSNIPLNCDLVIYTEAIAIDNPEKILAEKRNIPIMSYFQYLGQISKKYKTIAVIGTHGKTTTVGLLSAGFLNCGFDLTIFVGSKLAELNYNNFQLGTNTYLLVEACEYRNSFQWLHPEIVILTHGELDHIDYYHNQKHYTETLTNFCQNANTLIYHKDDYNSQQVAINFRGKKYAIPNSNPENYDLSKLNIFGKHNQQNARLAFQCAKVLDLDQLEFFKGISKYKGAWRRQEFLGTKYGLEVFNDYGHHPTEIRVTIDSFREKFPHSKIGLIFEPHQYSRTKYFFEQFCISLKEADYVGLFPIYSARDTKKDKQSVNIKDFIDKYPKWLFIKNLNDAYVFSDLLKQGDILLFMGAGEIDDLARKFIIENRDFDLK